MALLRIALLTAFILSPAHSQAQSIELFGMTGVASLWDDEGNLGAGAPFGGGIGVKSPHGWGVEILAGTQKVSRNFDSDVRLRSTVLAARARLLKYFGAGRAQPYAGAGLGVARIETTRDSPSGCAFINNVFTCSGRDVSRRESTSGAFSGLAGVRIAAGSLFFVRPEFELLKAGEHMRIGGVVAVGASW